MKTLKAYTFLSSRGDRFWTIAWDMEMAEDNIRWTHGIAWNVVLHLLTIDKK